VPLTEPGLSDATRLFAESPTRFLVEVAPDDAPALERTLGRAPYARIGQVLDSRRFRVVSDDGEVIDTDIDTLTACWRMPLAKATA
jgi:phosphoribosylformylglycinamidine synthase subunit PurSL